MPDTPDWGTLIAQGAIEVPNSPFNVPLSTTSNFTATPDPIAHALAICVTPTANAVNVVVTGVQTGIVYATRQFSSDTGVVEVPAIPSMDTGYTIAVTANATGAVTCHVVAVPDAPPWGTLIVRGGLQTNNSPFTVLANSGVTKNVVPQATAHALAIVLSNVDNVAILDVMGHQTGSFYCRRQLNISVGCIIVPIVPIVDTSYDVTVSTFTTGPTNVNCVSLDDVMAQGIFTDFPQQTTGLQNVVYNIPKAPTNSYINSGTGLTTPGVLMPPISGKKYHLKHVVFRVINFTGANAYTANILVKESVTPTTYCSLDLQVTAVVGAQVEYHVYDIESLVGGGIQCGFQSNAPVGCTAYLNFEYYLQ